MTFGMAQASQLDGGWGTIAALVTADGSASHPVARALAQPTAPMRDVADAIHALCMLHGRHPGAIDHANAANSDPVAEAIEAVIADGCPRGVSAMMPVNRAGSRPIRIGLSLLRRGVAPDGVAAILIGDEAPSPHDG